MANSIGGGGGTGGGNGGTGEVYPDVTDDGLPVDELRELWRYRLYRPSLDGVPRPLYREQFAASVAALREVPFGKWLVRIADELGETAEMMVSVQLSPANVPDAPALTVEGEPYGDRTINTGTVHGIGFYRASDLNAGESPPNTVQGIPYPEEAQVLAGFADIRAHAGDPTSPFQYLVSLTPFIERQPVRDNFGTYVPGLYAYTSTEAIPHCVVYPSFKYLGETPPGYAFTDMHVNDEIGGYRFYTQGSKECYAIDQYGNVNAGPYPHAAIPCPCRDNGNRQSILSWAGTYVYDSGGNPADTIEPTQQGTTHGATYTVTECKDGEYQPETPKPKPDLLKLTAPIFAIILVLLGLLILALAAFLLAPTLLAAAGIGVAGEGIAATAATAEAAAVGAETAAEGSALADIIALEQSCAKAGYATSAIAAAARAASQEVDTWIHNPDTYTQVERALTAAHGAEQEIIQALGRLK